MLGISGSIQSLINLGLKSLPGVDSLIQNQIEKDVEKTVSQMFQTIQHSPMTAIPTEGLSKEKIFDILNNLKKYDISPSEVSFFF